MSAHTPGPWVYEHVSPEDREEVGGAFLVAQTDINGDAICVLVDPVRNGEPEANARLIAQVPRMAELLLSAYQHVSHGGPKRGDVEDVLRAAGLIS